MCQNGISQSARRHRVVVSPLLSIINRLYRQLLAVEFGFSSAYHSRIRPAATFYPPSSPPVTAVATCVPAPGLSSS